MHIEHNNSDPAQAIRSLLESMFRWKRLIVAVFLTVAVAGVAATLLMPKTYESSMKILVKNYRVDSVVGPGETSGFAHLQVVDESRLNSEIELLTSSDLLKEVVLSCKLDGREAGDGDAEPDPGAVEQAVLDLKDGLEITPIRKTAVIHISYASKSPSQAANVLQTLSKLYFAKHLEVRRTPGTLELFETQARVFQTRLEGVEAELAEFHRRVNVVAPELEIGLVLQQLQDTESRLYETEVELRENRKRVGEAKAQIRELQPRTLTQSRSMANQQSVEKLNTMLAELKNQRTDLLTKFNDGDRLVMGVEQQIRDTEAALKRAGEIVSVEEATDVNPLYQTIQNELAQAELNVATLEVRRDAILKEQMSSHQARLEVLEGAVREEAVRTRAIAAAQTNLDLYSQKREEARIADLLDLQKITNVVMVEQPMLPSLPSGPNVVLYCALAVILGGFLSIASALTMQGLSAAVRTPQDVETSTGIPVLATVAYEGRSSDV